MCSSSTKVYTALCVKWAVKLAAPGCGNLSGAREVTGEVSVAEMCVSEVFCGVMGKGEQNWKEWKVKGNATDAEVEKRFEEIFKIMRPIVRADAFLSVI